MNSAGHPQNVCASRPTASAVNDFDIDTIGTGVVAVIGDHARRANRLLVEWVRANGLAFDSWDEPAGEHFGCRYEAYLTDPRSERMKSRWQVELSIRVTEVP
jgi:hypothetical protein